MALTYLGYEQKKGVHSDLTLDELYAVRKKQSLEERKRYCAYCEKKFYLPISQGGTTWRCVADRTHGFFCKESCAAMWAVEKLTECAKTDDWTIRL